MADVARSSPGGRADAYPGNGMSQRSMMAIFDLEREALEAVTADRDRYRAAYQAVVAEQAQAHAALDASTAERDKYRDAYNDVMAKQDQTSSLRSVLDELAALKANVVDGAKRQKNVEALQLLAAIRSNTFDPGAVFTERPPHGSGKDYVICNSIPKSGTHLLLELVKRLGAHQDIGYHTYSSSLRRRRDDGSFEAERQVPGLLWAQDLKPGYTCASHTQYCPYIEQYFLSRADHKMLMIIRDPRDLVVSSVDFVFNSKSYRQMTAWNEFSSVEGLKCHPDDDSQISSSIDGLLKSGLEDYYSWLNSPACLVVKFEDLYGELSTLTDEPASTPTIDRICEYLALEKPANAVLQQVLGHGLTESGREKKIGIYKTRMNSANRAKIEAPEFHRMVLELGYR